MADQTSEKPESAKTPIFILTGLDGIERVKKQAKADPELDEKLLEQYIASHGML
jgi:hypothetical protein